MFVDPVASQVSPVLHQLQCPTVFAIAKSVSDFLHACGLVTDMCLPGMYKLKVS